MALVTLKVVALSGLALLAPAAAQNACEAEVVGHDSDEVPLLQVARARATGAAAPGEEPAKSATAHKSCRFGYPVKTGSQCNPQVTSALAEEGLRSVGWWNLPEQPEGPSASDKLTPFDDFANYSAQQGAFMEAATFGTAAAEDAVQLMFEATKVSGLFEHVPESLRGVFWMKGNGMAEELTVLQFGRWFGDAGTYVQAMGQLSWAWPVGKPEKAPFHGAMYYPGSAESSASYLNAFPAGISYKFSDCPKYSRCYRKNSMDNMSFAYMQLHPLGVVGLTAPIGDLVSATVPGIPTGAVSGVFTLEAEPESPSQWYRGIRWGRGKHSTCAPMNFGSYTLVRLVDGEGQAVGSNLQEFVEYMGDVPLLMWTGFKSPEARAYVKSQLGQVDKVPVPAPGR